MPAISGTRTNLRSALQSAVQRVTAGRQQRMLRHGLLVLEVTLAVVLLSGAGLLMRSFVNVLRYDSGFDARDILTATTLLSGSRYQSLSARRLFAERLLPRLKAIPGLQAAALATAVPLRGADGDAFSVDNPNPPVGTREVATSISISPDYFRAVGTPLFQGRPFSMDDTATSAAVVIVNRSFARHYFNGHALGKRFYIGEAVQQGTGLGYGFVATTIVGVAADVRHNGIEHEEEPEFYLPLAQIPAYSLDLILRSDLDFSRSWAAALRYPDDGGAGVQPCHTAQTDYAARCLLRPARGDPRRGRRLWRFTYSLSQRTQEIGIRLALGRLARAGVAPCVSACIAADPRRQRRGCWV
jgi:MacB-like periplasmic core domain